MSETLACKCVYQYKCVQNMKRQRSDINVTYKSYQSPKDKLL